MQTSRPDNCPGMSSHNSDQPKPGNIMTTSQLVRGSVESTLSRNCSAFLDSPGLRWQDQVVERCSKWGHGCSSHRIDLEQPHRLIEKKDQIFHGCNFLRAEKEGLFLSSMELNLARAGTTAFSGSASQETGHGNTFCRTGISSYTGSQMQIPQCQAEGCKANLSSAKQYHRRHKVCELHSKASTVVVGSLIQRFCQQCSRFHPRSEFDQAKRSCRKRLADHNRRRRKNQPSRCATSQCQAGRTALEDEKQKSEGLSGHDATGFQIIPNMTRSTSSTPSFITSVTLSSSGLMMMFPNTYKRQITVLQGTSNDRTSCVEFLCANIAQTGSHSSQEGLRIADHQILSSNYEIVHPCSLGRGHLGLQIP